MADDEVGFAGSVCEVHLNHCYYLLWCVVCYVSHYTDIGYPVNSNQPEIGPNREKSRSFLFSLDSPAGRAKRGGGVNKIQIFQNNMSYLMSPD